MDRVDDWRAALEQLDKPQQQIVKKSQTSNSNVIDLTLSDGNSSSSSSSSRGGNISSPNSVRIIERPQIPIRKPLPLLPPPPFRQQQLPSMKKQQQQNRNQQQQQQQNNYQSTSTSINQFSSNPFRTNIKPIQAPFVSKAEGFMSVKERAMAEMKSNAVKMGIPIGVPANLPYKRPPIIKSTTPRPRSPIKKVPDEVVLTEAEQEAALKELFSASSDINEADLAEPQPEGLKATLFPHQKAGLHWLRKRETSPFRGGILADLMGLGKTVQMISLMLANKPVKTSENKYNRSTLIICPVALMEQWKEEILSKTEPGSLSVYIHHGPNRREDETYVFRRNVVITSYSTVVSEWTAAGDDSDSDELIVTSKSGNKGKGKAKAGKGGVLFQGGEFTFHRIILDEAHNIKNRASKGQKACRALLSTYRWCLTGTPIQNSIDDLFSLFEFLGKGTVGPYYEYGVFKEKISKLIKSKNEKSVEVAMARLRPILAAAMLRRNKSLLILPRKTIIEVKGPFLDEKERLRYVEIEAKMQNKMDRLVKAGGVNQNYISVLSLLLRMRQACSHRLLTKLIQNQEEKVDSEVEEISGDEDSSSDLEEIKPLTTPEEEDEEEEEDDGLDGLIGALGGLKVVKDSPSVKTLCGLCQSQCRKIGDSMCQVCKSDMKIYGNLEFSTKIRRAMRILMDIRKENPRRKTIVFSQFTSFFDIFEPFLKKGGFKFCRYDGSMNVTKKEAALDKIRKDSSYTIILISIKAGAVGLNLTECSRVLLMDLWWNPQIQEQAFDRAHRMGQKDEVIIYKLSVDNSIEDRILVLQTAKAELAAAALDGGAMSNQSKLSAKELLYLFKGDGILPNANNGIKKIVDALPGPSSSTSSSTFNRKY